MLVSSSTARAVGYVFDCLSVPCFLPLKEGAEVSMFFRFDVRSQPTRSGHELVVFCSRVRRHFVLVGLGCLLACLVLFCVCMPRVRDT